MARLSVPGAVRRATEVHLTSCGGGRRECVVIWTARLDQPSRVVRVVHPLHAASAVSTEMASEAISGLSQELVERRERIVAQIHSHPGAAFHSSTDDAYPLIHSRGFLSIVVPTFGRDGLLGLPGCHVAEHLGICRWKELVGAERDELIRWEGVR